jgi:hypothetical protein
MSFRIFPGGLPRRFRVVQQSFLQHDGLAFAEVLPEQDIQTAFEEEGASFAQEEGDVYTPSVTLWAFLSQAVFKEEHRSCVAAVARVAVLMVMLNRRVSSDTGTYCRARAKLPEVVLERLVLQVGDGCEAAALPHWRWHARRTFLVDGTTLSGPDTPANQIAWPQPATQQKGLGFPLIRMVVMLSLATALITGMAMGPAIGKETGETALFRQLLPRLQPGDVFVADRYLCSYFMVALAQQNGVDAVIRQHQRRITDFRRGTSWARRSSDTVAAPGAARVDGCGNLRADAGIPGYAGTPGPCPSARLPHGGLCRGHHVDGSPHLLVPRYRGTIPQTLARGIGYPRHQDQHGDGCAAVPFSPHDTQRNLDRPVGLQPDPQDDPRGGHRRRRITPTLSFTAAMQAIAAGWTAVLLLERSGASPIDRHVSVQSAGLPRRPSTEPD